MVEVFGFSGFGVAVFALISAIVSVALDYWTYFEQSGFKSYSGLWKQCVNTDCVSIPDAAVTTELKAVRAMLILALLLIFGAIVCGGLKLFMMKTQKMLGYIAAALLGVAGLFLIAGFAVYVSKVFQPAKDVIKLVGGPTPTLHAGFALCIISWLASWVAAGLFGVATMMEKE